MNKYFIAAMIGLIMLTAAFGTSQAQATSTAGAAGGSVSSKTTISKGFNCNMFDQNGVLGVITTQSTATKYKLVCTTHLDYWTKYTVLTFTSENTGGRQCGNVNGETTSNWMETVFPQGNARLVCYFTGHPPV